MTDGQPENIMPPPFIVSGGIAIVIEGVWLKRCIQCIPAVSYEMDATFSVNNAEFYEIIIGLTFKVTIFSQKVCACRPIYRVGQKVSPTDQDGLTFCPHPLYIVHSANSGQRSRKVGLGFNFLDPIHRLNDPTRPAGPKIKMKF